MMQYAENCNSSGFHSITLLLYPFNGLFSRTTWVSWHQKGKQFWILLEQEMMGWQWHQLDHMQIMPVSHHSVFLQSERPSWCPTNSIKALKHYSSWLKLVIANNSKMANTCPFLFVSVICLWCWCCAVVIVEQRQNHNYCHHYWLCAHHAVRTKKFTYIPPASFIKLTKCY